MSRMVIYGTLAVIFVVSFTRWYPDGCLWAILIFFFFQTFFHPIHYLRPSIISLLVVTQIQGHIAGFSSPLPTKVRALHFSREKISALPSSTRVELCLLTLGALSSWSSFFYHFFFIFANRFKISPRRDSNSRTNTINSSIRGLPLVHRGDVLYCCTILLIRSM